MNLGSNNKNLSKVPKWFYIVLFIIPLVFLILLEFGLTLSKYGDDYSVFVPLGGEYSELLVFNPNYPKKFFKNTSLIPSVIPDPFSKNKQDNSFRVFVLGGSSTAGFPFSYNASFSRRVKRRLDVLFPHVNLEIVNMGISAVNSYTILDVIPEIISQKPDLVIIYAGHNEYYGALGVGSTESIDGASWLINLTLKLRNFKTYQFISNILEFSKNLFRGNSKVSNQTLMEQMVQEKLIPSESEMYNNGLRQFKNNMNDALNLLSQAEIHTIISTVSSNLKQKPFESISSKTKSADDYFYQAENYFQNSDFQNAKSNYILAKNLDALRFRAPTKINDLIKELADKYKVSLVNTDSLFSSISLGTITGYNLMTDHLHPNVRGHQIIGDLFFDKMVEKGFLPKTKKQNFTQEEQIKFANNSLAYTSFDSVYASSVLSKLLNSYPFVKSQIIQTPKFIITNYLDSLAQEVITGKISWEQGHFQLAEIYLRNSEYKKFISEMMTLIQDKPFIKENYTYTIEQLRNKGQLNLALQLLLKMNRRFNDTYSTKLIGNIAINKRAYNMAIFYYEKFIKVNTNDPEVYYNLSGAYLYSKMINKAILSLEKCLSISPNYPEAKSTLERIKMLKK